MNWLSVGTYTLLGGLVIGIIYGSCIYIYNRGYDSGIHYQINETNKQIALLENQIKEREKIYYEDIQTINLELQKTQDQYEMYIASLSGSYDSELLKHKQRAELYQRAASAGEAKSKRLASYAARLDRSLTEGRQVVKELRATLIQRDNQIKQLADYIRTSRKLYGN